MKNILMKTVCTLLRPLLWCRQVILDASECMPDYNPAGYIDYVHFAAAEQPRPRPVRIHGRVVHICSTHF